MLFIGVAVEHKLSTVSMFILAILIYICVITIMPYVMRKYVKELTGQDTLSFTCGYNSLDTNNKSTPWSVTLVTSCGSVLA